MPEKFASMMTVSTSDFCELHQRPYLIFEGESVCPTCECDSYTEETRKVEQAKADKFLDQLNYNVLYNDSILQDKTLINAGFKGYSINVQEGTEEYRNKERAFKVFQKYLNGEVFNTWFTGDTGVGKSHLAMSILRSINEMQDFEGSCIFVDIDEALRRVRERFDSNEGPYTEKYVVDLMVKADFLVIDDLGAETGNIDTGKKASDFVSRIIRAVLNGRQEKATMFTTNLTRSTLQQVYDEKLISRAFKNTALINFENSKDKRVSTISLD